MATMPSNPALMRSDLSQTDPNKLSLVGYAQAQSPDGDPHIVAICSYKGKISALSEGDLERGIDAIEIKAKQETGDKNIAGVCVYNGLVKVITASEAANGGLDAAMAAARADLKIQEEQIKKNQEAERKFEQAMLGAGIGAFTAIAASETAHNLSPMREILGGMHDTLAHDGGASLPKLEQPGLMSSVLGFLGIGTDKQAPATPKPTDQFVARMRDPNNSMTI